MTTNGDNLDVKFHAFMEEFDLFRTIKNSKYNRDKQLLQIPLSEKHHCSMYYASLTLNFFLMNKTKSNKNQAKQQQTINY